MTKTQQFLDYKDIVIITFIMFNLSIWGAFMTLNGSGMETFALQEIDVFTEENNFATTIIELIQLGLTFAYLYFIKYDFNNIKFEITKQTIPHAIGLFVVCAAMMDLIVAIFNPNFFAEPFTLNLTTLTCFLQECTFSLIFVSVLNGFFEEFFFLGLCLSVKPDWQKYMLLFSLVIRVLIHVYQGFPHALAIGLGIGLLFYFYYEKISSRNLAPLVIAHILADIFGLSVFNYILY